MYLLVVGMGGLARRERARTPAPTGPALEFEVAPPSPAPSKKPDVRSAYFVGVLGWLRVIWLQLFRATTVIERYFLIWIKSVHFGVILGEKPRFWVRFDSWGC